MTEERAAETQEGATRREEAIGPRSRDVGGGFDVVVAADEAGGIGTAGKLPWHLPGDLAFFVRLTREAPAGRQNAVIMGRLTWESIPARFRPLKGRINLVMSRNPGLALPPAVRRCAGLDEALAEAKAQGAARVFVIGGAQVYLTALAHPSCRSVFLTRVAGRFECDATLPALRDFREAQALGGGSDGGLSYRFWRLKPAKNNQDS